jgi:predicted dehydrogenase
MRRDGTIGVGVIGRGFGRTVVAPIFAEADGCEVVDVVSPRDDEAVGALCNDDHVDLVAVHSPPFLHRACVDRALDAGKAVLCDKPFGRNAADATAMVEHAEAADAMALLNFEFRHHPGRMRLRELVLDGAVGDVRHVQWSVFGSGFVRRRWGWLFDAELGGGWIGAWGSHVIDFLRWTFGDITEADAELRTIVTERPDREGTMHRCTAEDSFTARLRTASGVSVTIDTSFVTPANVPPRAMVVGSEGVLEVLADVRITRRTLEGSEEVFALDPVSPEDDPHFLPMRGWVPVVLDAVRNGAIPDGEATFADGLACARVMDQLRA